MQWIYDNFLKVEIGQAEAASDVEKQTEKAHSTDTIWSFVRAGDVEGVKKIIADNPSVMREHGPVGDIPLHLCFLYNSEKQIQMAWDMIAVDKSIVLEEYTGDEYAGENVLHIAIINRRLDLVKKLLELEPKLLNSKAYGNFFKKGKPCYYGEYPLAFAISTNQFEIFDALLAAGADMNVEDSNGNNILHVLVTHGLQDAYTYFKKTWVDKYGSNQLDDGTYERNGKTKEGLIVPWKRRNHNLHTPFTLCAHDGIKDMFYFLMEERKQVQWSYGPVTCMLYPLDELDDLHHREVQEKHDGALELILNNSHYELLTHPRIIDLIEKKWVTFGLRHLLARFFHVIIYLMLFTHFTIQRQTIFHFSAACVEDQVCTPRTPISAVHYTYFYALFVLVLLGAASKGWNELVEMQASGVKSYFSATGSAFLENTVSLVFFVLVIGFTVAHIFSSPFERLLLGAANFVGYAYLFFFLLALKMTGPMVIMVYEMLQKDVLRFSVVYAVFLFGFSQAFYVLQDNHGAQGFYDSVHMCFEASLGDFNFGESHGAESLYRTLSIFLLVGYILVVSICLLNLLIAMMGDTYGKVNEMAEHTWQLERARIIMALENEMTPEERKLAKNKYFVEILGERYLQIYDNDLEHFSLKKKSTESDKSD